MPMGHLLGNSHTSARQLNAFAWLMGYIAILDQRFDGPRYCWKLASQAMGKVRDGNGRIAGLVESKNNF